ncbi:MAG: metalloregulator ArsR/SmtB family transcription factor [Gammaproteobacteria bacterium]|nr:metalloregulator ArsR/SmtB family transcription factor [Gammaproteobacteria bacterium]
MIISAKEFFQILSDETRLRCLLLMQSEGELCVCEFIHALGVIQPKVSRHLALLRDAAVVSDRRQGQWVYYQLHCELPDWARQVLLQTAQGVATVSPFCDDRVALSNMPNRPGAACCD